MKRWMCWSPELRTSWRASTLKFLTRNEIDAELTKALRSDRWHGSGKMETERVSLIRSKLHAGAKEYFFVLLVVGMVIALQTPRMDGTRSEERRVGKECRSRW